MIAFLGISHLSLCYSAATLSKGYSACIVDLEKEINQYKQKTNTIFEPGLKDLQLKHRNKLTITSDFSIIKKAKIIFVAKDVKTNNNNVANYIEVKNLIKKIKIYKKSKVLVIMCQVEPGFTRDIDWSLNKKYHFVETLVFGKAISRALNPERIIIGKSKKNIKIHKYFNNYLRKFTNKIIDLNYEESELTKTYINIYLASQVTTTNILNEISKSYNARWKDIKSAIQLDRRIGKFSYLEPGLGISGGNIERDIKTLEKLSLKKKISSEFFKLLQNKSKYFKSWAVRECKSSKSIGILGMTYKENSKSTKNSAQSYLIKNLNKNSKIYFHDKKLKNFNSFNRVVKYKEFENILMKVDTLIIFHNINLYKNINVNKYKNIKKIIDPFKVMIKKPTKKKYSSL